MRVGIVLFLVLLIAMLGIPGLAAADGGGADVIRGVQDGLPCGIGGAGYSITTYDWQAVVTPSGSMVLKCTGDIPEGSEPAKAVRDRGGPGRLCGIQDATGTAHTTANWQAVFTPSGKAHLTCQISGSG